MVKKRKDTVRQGKANIQKTASTQRYIQFAGVRENTLILKNGGLRAILQVGSVNLNLKSEPEQEATIRGYQRLLNSLNFPVQILVQSRKLDIDHYVQSLKQKRKTQENELLRDQMDDYIHYISRLVEYADIMEKRFYLVIPANPAAAESKSLLQTFLSYIQPEDTVVKLLNRRKSFAQLKRTLEERINVVMTSLEGIGISGQRLSTAEIIDLLYKTYNPDLSRTAKLTHIDDLSLEDAPEE